MRTHKQIIADAGGPMRFARALGIEEQIFTVRSWAARNSIPAPFWCDLEDLGLAALEELAQAVRRPEPLPRRRFRYVMDCGHRLMAVA